MRQIRYRLYIAWDFASYVDESSNLMSASGDFSLTPPGDGFSSGRGIISSMKLTLDNSDGRYSPLNTSSAIYANIQDGKAYHAPCYLEVSINNGTNYYRVFTGVIKWPQPSGLTTKDIAVIELECRSLEEKYLQNKLTTLHTDFVAYHDTNFDESDIISDWLTELGVSGGSMTLDSGMITIPWLWLDDESPIEEIWKLAAACGGRFYADPDGEFIYESAVHWLISARSTTGQETLNENDFEKLEMVYEDKDLFSSVLVEAAPREVIQPDVLWEPDETMVIPPSTTVNYTAKLRQPAYTINDATFVANAAGGTDITSSVSITQVAYAQRVELAITNAHATHAAYLRPFSITGRSVDGSATIEEERNATDDGTNGAYFTTRGDRQKSIRGNVYVQSRQHAAMIASYLMRQAEFPRITYKMTAALGNANRRLGDMVTISDSSIMSSSRTAIITSIRWRLDSKGFKQDITLIDSLNLYPYQNTTPTYFTLGLNYLGTSHVDKGRLFF